jgi:transcriptional regulator with XRE-family HTH domain
MTSLSALGKMLRHHRLVAGLSQEELAERAALSVHSISNFERGATHAPHKDTVRLLAQALRLSPDDEAALLAAAQVSRRRYPVNGAASDATLPRQRPLYHVPAPPTPLVGREDLVARVCDLLQGKSVRLLTLLGVGGVGKTHLALEVARRAADTFADGAVFVSLASLRDAGLRHRPSRSRLASRRAARGPSPSSLPRRCEIASSSCCSTTASM